MGDAILFAILGLILAAVLVCGHFAQVGANELRQIRALMEKHHSD